MCLEQVFDVPKDSHIDKIRGKFEEARLSLFMPKKVVTEKQEPQRAVSCEKKPEEAQTPKDEAKTSEMREEKGTQQEKQRYSPAGDHRLQEYKQKAVAWKLKIADEVEGWLDYGLMDGWMDGWMETISKNKKEIALAAAAFSAGFYVAGKLRSSGR